MNQSAYKISIAIEFAASFLYWLTISNFIFRLWIFIEDHLPADFVLGIDSRFKLLCLLLWFTTIITISVLCFRQRVWIAAGIVTEVLITAGLWIIRFMPAQETLIEKILFTIIPLPLGLGLFFRA